MSRKIILVGVSGGIASYKTVTLVSQLVKDSFSAHVIMTENAQKFVTPLTYRTISNNPVITKTFDDSVMNFPHLELAKDPAILVIAPATANIIGKFACGIADDILSTTFLSVKCPVLIAPAMNTRMYKNAIVQRNIKILKDNKVEFIGPEEGKLACGEEGLGRMSEPEDILNRIKSILE